MATSCTYFVLFVSFLPPAYARTECGESCTPDYLVQLQQHVQLSSEPVAAQSSLVSSHSQSRTKTCAALEGRAFEFQDDMCGTEHYKVADMLEAFQIEQAYWAEQGTTNPWWAVDTQFPQGAVYPLERQLKFYAGGVRDVNKMMPLMHSVGLFKKAWLAQATALDFGCGLGRMSNALASVGFAKVMCVDQAHSFLDTAKKSLTKLAGQGVVVADVASRVEFVQSDPDLLCRQKPSSIDFVHSIITLQHMKPMLQVAYIEQLCDVLRPGGVGYFQIPTFIQSTPDVHCKLQSETKAMMMHYTSDGEVERHLKLRGCRVLKGIDTSSTSEYNMIGDAGASMLFIFEKDDDAA